MKQKTVQVFVGRRKTSVARVTVRPGKGNVIVNNVPVQSLGNEVAKAKMLTPLYLTADFWKKHDFHVTVYGGGVISSADAVAFALAKAAAEHKEGSRQELIAYDRYLLAGDPRLTEPKKPNRRSARRFKQKSYR